VRFSHPASVDAVPAAIVGSISRVALVAELMAVEAFFRVHRELFCASRPAGP